MEEMGRAPAEDLNGGSSVGVDFGAVGSQYGNRG